MSNNTVFYLVSSETTPLLAPRKCVVTQRLRVEGRDDFAVVSIQPPIPRGIYGAGLEDLCQLVLATRWGGTTLWPVSVWPIAVYICIIRDQTVLQSNSATTESVGVIAIGHLFPTLVDANRDIDREELRREARV